MLSNPCSVYVSSFDLSKAVTMKRFFSKVKLSPSSRLVIRCLIDFYNPQKGLVYPGQKTVAECTGLTERSIVSAVNELRKEGLILTTKKKNSLNYYFSNRFFEILGLQTGEKISDESGKIFIKQGEKISDTYIEQKKEQIKNKVLKFQNNVQELNHTVSIESTKKLLKEKSEIKRGSPLDFTYEEAVSFLENLLPELQNSFFAIELRKKWNIFQDGKSFQPS